MRVAGEVRSGLRFEQVREDSLVAIRGNRNPGLRSRQPILHLTPRAVQRDWLSDHMGVAHETRESQQSRPGEPNLCGAVEGLLEPDARDLVVWRAGFVCVNEDVGV